MKIALLFVSCFIALSATAQLSEQYLELKTFAGKQTGLPTDSSLALYPYYHKALHYLYPLYKAFQKEKTILAATNATTYYDQLSQALAFVGDYASVLQLSKLGHDPVGDTSVGFTNKQAETVKSIQYVDARQYILKKAATSRVVMINEAHDKPLHRAFTASLLEGLYQQGFRYLAMETLNTNRNTPLTRLNMYTGHYTCEPMGGELVRRALEIGYKLVAYEDSLAYKHGPNQREYIQASNINAVLKKDSTAKILVHAGYGHISKVATDAYIPMAAYFSVISGIDPLTIDQTTLSEGSTSNDKAAFYETWLKLRPVAAPAVPLQSDTAFDPFGYKLYDVYLIHPLTRFSNGRPNWVNMDGWKKEFPVPPAFQSLFFVQAYYANEYNDKTAGLVVPADQTYINAPNGYYYLYLRKGRYKLVFRNKLYAVLGIREIDVK